MRWLTAICGLAAASVAAGAPGPSFGADPSRDSPAWTLQRVRQEFQASRKRLQSVYLEATAHGRPRTDPQERVRMTLAGKSVV